MSTHAEPAQAATRAPDPGESLHGSSLARSPDGRILYVADTEGRRLVAVDVARWEVVATREMPGGPEQVVVGRGGGIFVSLRWAGAVAALDPDHLDVVAHAAVGTEPWGLALSPDGRTLYAGAAQSRTLTALDAHTLEKEWTVALPDAEPRGIAVAPDGGRAYVVHMRAPRVSIVDLARGVVEPSVSLPPSGLGPLTSRGLLGDPSAPGTPNRALAAMVSPDGKRLFVPFDLKDGSRGGRVFGAGYYGGGVGGEPVVSVLASIAIDGSGDTATLTSLAGLLDPSDLRLAGDRLTISGAGPVGIVLDVSIPWRPIWTNDILLDYGEGISADAETVFAFDPIEMRLWRHDADGDLAPVASLSVGDDPWPERAMGRKLFHRRSLAISSEAMACQTCHPDGRQDGVVWSIGSLGPLQTPILAGHVTGTAPYRWLGTSPTLAQSIHTTVEGLGGAGLGPHEVGALADYLEHGLRPIPKPAHALTEVERRGKALFESASVGCASCHIPSMAFQDGGRHDVGASAAPTGETFGFDTPTLRNLSEGAPYLHDGSAPDVENVLDRLSVTDRMGHASGLDTGEVAALAAYLRTL